MKILYICDEYPPGQNGGIGTSVQTLSRELVKMGHDVFVVGLYSYKYGQEDVSSDLGVKVYRLRYGLDLHLSVESRVYSLLDKLPNGVKQHLNGKKAFTRFIEFINTLIEKEKLEVIEIADYNNFSQHIGFAIKWPRFKIPLIVKSHGSHTYFCDELGIKPDVNLSRTDFALFARADAHSCVSYYAASKNKVLFNLDKKDIKVLYNGIDITCPTSNHDRDNNTVIFTGSLTHKKGIYSLISAWNTVHKKKPDARLLIFGKGKTKALRAMIDPESKTSVFFMGHLSKQTLVKHLASATVAVFPSYSETFGLGVVEAMAEGCPVIYTKRSCGPEIVKDNYDGLLVDPDNVDEITESILDLLNDPTKREKLASAAISSVKQKFDIKKIARDHIVFYDKIILQFAGNETTFK